MRQKSKRVFSGTFAKAAGVGFKTSEDGATVIEFAVLACVMGLVVVAFAGSGLSASGIYQRIQAVSGITLENE
jgi:Flp pilus assembly pilin Flp